jgi:hypothetical protein
MTQEIGRTWNVSEEAKKRWFESEEKMKNDRVAFVEKAKRSGETFDATLAGVWIPRPGLRGDPAVYRSNQDGSFFRVAGKRDEVASPNAPEEVQKRAKIRYRIPLDYVGEYAIVKFDLVSKIKDGILFYTPDGYIEDRRYNPEVDPPLETSLGVDLQGRVNLLTFPISAFGLYSCSFLATTL